MSELDQLRQSLDRSLSQRATLQNQIAEETRNLKKTRKRVDASTRTRAVLQTIAKQVQDQTHQQIAAVVSQCLECVFDDPYQLRIVFEQKRGRTEAQLEFERDGTFDPLTSTGGGVVDVASFALRLASIVLSKPHTRRVVVLDEPFKWLSADYQPRIKTLLELLADELQFQFVIVTHLEALKCGKIYEL